MMNSRPWSSSTPSLSCARTWESHSSTGRAAGFGGPGWRLTSLALPPPYSGWAESRDVTSCHELTLGLLRPRSAEVCTEGERRIAPRKSPASPPGGCGVSSIDDVRDFVEDIVLLTALEPMGGLQTLSDMALHTRSCL